MYPSGFLHQHLQNTSIESTARKGKSKIATKFAMYQRDIVCLPKGFSKEGDLIPIPRKRQERHFLAVNKLISKIQLRSAMREVQIFDEIRSVFRGPMGYDSSFKFKILQPFGGDSRSLMVPELSHSYHWTAGAVAGRNAKTPVYILAEDPLEVCYSYNRTSVCKGSVSPIPPYMGLNTFIQPWLN